MENRQLNFDVSRGGIQHRLFVRVGDTKSRTVSARMYSGSEAVPITAAYLRAVRPDGTRIYSACTVQDGEVVYTFTTEDLACGGELQCEFDLHSGESVMTSPKFIAVCEKQLYTGEGIETSDEYQAYIAALLKLENLTVDAVGGAEAGVTKEVTETGIALHFTLPVGNLDEEISEQEELIEEQESLAKVIAETLAGKKVSSSSGEDGATFTPHMDADGNLSWTNDKGLPNPETVNIKGADGDDYVLTDADKTEIATQAAEMVDTALLAVIGTGEVSV